MVGIICPPPVGIGLTDLPNIGGGGPVAPKAPPVPAPLLDFCSRLAKNKIKAKDLLS